MAICNAEFAADQTQASRSTTSRPPGAGRGASAGGPTGEGFALPGEDAAELERRTAEVVAELAADDAATTRLLAGRAAVLAVRLDRAARHEFAATAARVRAAGEAFDRDRQAEADRLLAAAADDPAAAADLRALPEGVDRLIAAVRALRPVAAAGTPGWTAEFARDLRRHLGAGADRPRSVAAVVAAIDAEVAALAAHARTLDRAAVAAARDEACRLALVADDPATLLARRYEAATERSIFRALKEIREFRRARAAAQVPTPAAAAAADPAATAASLAAIRAEIARLDPAGARGAAPPRPAPVGSFCPGAEPSPRRADVAPVAAGLAPARPRSRYEDRKKRPKVDR